MCERRKRIERRRCCRFHRFLQHLRQSVSQKPSCRAGRRALAECYTFFRFGAGFDDRRVVVWNPTPWRVICCAVRKCGRCSVAARAEVRAKLWGTREAEIRTGRPTGTIFPNRLAVRARLQKTGRLHLAAAAFPNAFPVGGRLVPRKSGGCNPRLVCAASYKAVWRPHLRFASRRKNRFLGRLPRAGKMLQDFYPPFYIGRQGGRAASRAVTGAAFPLRPARCGLWKPEGLSFARQRRMLLLCRRIFSPAF